MRARKRQISERASRERSVRRSKRRHEWIEAPIYNVCVWEMTPTLEETSAEQSQRCKSCARRRDWDAAAVAAGMLAALWRTFGHFLEDVTRHSGTNSDATSNIFIDLFWLLLLLFLLCQGVVLIANCFASAFLLRFVCHQLIFIYTYFQLNIIKLTLRARANSASLGRKFCVVSLRYSPPPAQRRAQPRVKSRRLYNYCGIVCY